MPGPGRLSRLIAALVVLLIHLRPASGQQPESGGEHAGIRVRFVEGSAHGFLELHDAAGTVIAHGDLLQRAKGAALESRLSLRFLDGSVFEETTEFTQARVFELRHYHLVQRGRAFATDLDASLSRNGHYHVISKSRADGEQKVYDDTLDLSPDVANGLVIVLAKNLDPTQSRRVQLVAFTPKPRLIELEFVPSGTQRVSVGPRSEAVQHFVLKPRLGSLTGFFANLLGKHPPDSHAWIVRDDVPTFLRFQGPMYLGAVWRLDLTTPTWPR